MIAAPISPRVPIDCQFRREATAERKRVDESGQCAQCGWSGAPSEERTSTTLSPKGST